MKRRNGFISHQVNDIYYIVPVGTTNIETHFFIRCNETAYSIWRWLENDVTEDELVQSMQKCYEIDKAQAMEDVRMILQGLREKNLLEEF